MWKLKRLNFFGSGSTLKKEAGSGGKLGNLYRGGSGSKKLFYCFHIPGNYAFSLKWVFLKKKSSRFTRGS